MYRERERPYVQSRFCLGISGWLNHQNRAERDLRGRLNSACPESENRRIIEDSCRNTPELPARLWRRARKQEGWGTEGAGDLLKAPRRWRCHVGSAKRMMSGGLPPLAGLLPKSSLRADFACALLFRRMNDNAVSACASRAYDFL